MNAEIAITVGDRRGVLAIQNAALRTQRDVASAAGVIGLTMDQVTKQLADARAKADSGVPVAGFRLGPAAYGCPQGASNGRGRTRPART